MGVEENSRYIMDLEEQWWEYQDEIDDLEKQRTEELKKAYEEQRKAAEESLREQLSALSDFADAMTEEYQDAFNAIMQKQESMRSKLEGYGELFHLTGTTVSLTNLDSMTKAIERYGNTLNQLRDRGINGALLDEILSMDVKSATLYGEKLLDATSREWADYMDAYQRKMDAAAQISENFFAGDVDALNTEYLQKALDGVAEMFEEFAGELPDGGEMRDYMAEVLRDSLSDTMETLIAPVSGSTQQNEEVLSLLRRMAEIQQGASTELVVQMSAEAVARAVLPVLISTAAANGTPIVNV